MSEAAIPSAARFRSLAAAILAMGVTSAIYSVSLPLFAARLDEMGHAEGTIGWNSAAQAVALFLVAPFAPWLLRRVGPAGLMIAMLVLSLVIFLVCPLTDDVDHWFVLRLVLGAATGLLWIAGEVWINEEAQEGARGRIVAFYGIAGAGGTMAGPLVLLVTGYQGWMPFLAIAAMSAATAGIVVAALKVAPRFEAGISVGVLRPFLAYPAPMLLNLVVASTFGALWTFLPIYGPAVEIPLAEVLWFLMVLSGGGALLQYPIGWLADRLSRRRLTLAVVVMMIAAFAVMTEALAEPWLRWPYLVALGGGMMGLYTLGLVLIGQRFRGVELGAATTTFQIMWNSGMVAGPLAAGYAMAAAGPGGLPWSLVVLYLLLLPVLGPGALRRRRA